MTGIHSFFSPPAAGKISLLAPGPHETFGGGCSSRQNTKKTLAFMQNAGFL